MTAHRTPAARHSRAGLLAAAAGELTASVTRRGRSPSSGLARGLVDASPAMLVHGGVALVGRRPLLGAAVATAPQAPGGYLALRRGDASVRDTAAATAAGMLTAATAVAPLPVRPPAVLAAVATGSAAVVAADRRARCRGAAARHGQDGNIKWLRRLTVIAAPPPSYWGRRGWADGTHPVHPASFQVDGGPWTDAPSASTSAPTPGVPGRPAPAAGALPDDHRPVAAGDDGDAVSARGARDPRGHRARRRRPGLAGDPASDRATVTRLSCAARSTVAWRHRSATPG
jgi:hypothetical protein